MAGNDNLCSLGSVRATTNGSGDVIATYKTDPFGVPLKTTGSSSQPFQFTGQQCDAESGLYDLRARMYDPSIGRFLQRDPTFGAKGIPLSLGRYIYVQDNPLSSADPGGHEGCGPYVPEDPCGMSDAAGDAAPWESGGAGDSQQPGSQAVSDVNADSYRRTQAYDVGSYNELVNRSNVGDNMGIHHVPQKYYAKKLIPGYVDESGTSIALPDNEHGIINRAQQAERAGRSAITDPGELVRQDIEMLQRFTQAPQQAIDSLRELIKQRYGI